VSPDDLQLALKGEGTSEAIAYDQITELRLADLYYKAKGTPHPTEARRAHHFTLLPDHQSASLQLSYDDAWQVQPNPSKATKMLIAVAAFLAFVVVLGAMVAD
jgi:hypothetical protein